MVSTIKDDFVNSVVKDTLEYFKEQAPEDFARLESEPDHKKAIIDEITTIAKEQKSITNDLKIGAVDNNEEVLRRHLSNERMQLMEGALKIETFTLDLLRRLDDGKYVAEFSKNGVQIKEPRLLTSTVSIELTKIMQYASIVVEAVMLVLSAVGIRVTPGKHVIEQAVEEAAHVIQRSSKLQKVIQVFVKAWNNAGGSKFAKARALFDLIKDIKAAGILWTIIKSICANMGWLDWIKTAAQVTAMIIAALASGGAALIARIGLILWDTVKFAKKLINLGHLDKIMNEIEAGK